MGRFRSMLGLWALALAASAGLFAGADRVMAQVGCAGFQIGATTAAPDPVAAGGTETINTQVCSGSAASSIIIDLEIFNTGGQKVGQTLFTGQNFAPGQTKSFRWDYAVSQTLQPGLHTVKVGVFSAAWQLHRWDNQADTFTVASGGGGCAGAGFTILPTSASPDPVTLGGTETINTQVCSSSAASSIIIDLEIFNTGGQKVGQTLFTGQNFAPGQTKSFRWDYAVSQTLQPGLHTVKVGVFSAAWQLHRWDNQAALMHVGGGQIALVPVVTGLSAPVYVTNAGDSRLFIVERIGRIRIFSGGQLLTFLDISNRIPTSGEQGLASIAFDPDHASNGFFYVFYEVSDADPVTNPGGHIRVSRFHVSNNPNVADPASEQVVITIPHTKTKEHFGGQLAFGPDGFLYISTGDGGHIAPGPPDPDNNAQSLGSRLGKLLRIDVSTLPYTVPPDNPFVNTQGAWPEIWALGLRNAWRFGFDRQTGDLYLSDVGEHDWEEINFAAAGSPGGVNYGWKLMEGPDCIPPGTTSCQGIPGLTRPVLALNHDPGECAVIGGYVYRGTTNPALSSLRGAYVFGDYCTGRIWRAFAQQNGTWVKDELIDSSFSIVGFGQDAAGELYVVNYPTQGTAGVYRLQ